MLQLRTHRDILLPSASPLPSVRAFLQKYIEDFLCKPHLQLGRTGPVCPFMSPALRQNSVYYAIIEDICVTPERIDAVLADVCTKYVDLSPTSGMGASYKAVIVLFPYLDVQLAPALIDEAQQRKKPSFVARGLMLGEFHGLNTTVGLRCPASSTFFPLQTPIPALAIRSLVSSDIAFLDRESSAPEVRASYMQSYHARFPQEIALSSDPSSQSASRERPPSPTPRSLSSTLSSSHTAKDGLTWNTFFLVLFALLLLLALALVIAPRSAKILAAIV